MDALIVMAAGALLVIGGVALMSVPFAFIVTGLMFLAAGADLVRSDR